ncbi:MAG: outer membrane protein transport protein, partial [Pseudomonadota bacterium]
MTWLRHAISLALSTTYALAAWNAAAGGFAIGTQSGSGTGNAYSGGAASAEDASVVWYNPAAMTALPSGKHVSSALHAIKPSFKFLDSGSTFPVGTGEGGDGGDWAYIPNAYFATDLGRGWHAGVGLNAPFGLATHYDAGWRGQFTALKSEIKSLNINPAIAYKMSDTLSIGAGVSVQKLQAKLSSFSGAAALGNVTLKADDIGFGFNAGVLFQPTASTRFGVSYRSSFKYELEGDARFSGPAGALFNGDISVNVRVPETLSFSAFRALNKNWELMADITRTGWDRVQQLVVVRTSASAGGAAGSTFTTLPFEWKDTWRFGVGANYKVNDALKL